MVHLHHCTAINASLPLLSPDALIVRVLEEDHTWKSSQGVDTALQAQNQQGKGGQNDGTTKSKCNNCGKKGHWVRDCWDKGGGKEGQAPQWWKGDKAKGSTGSTQQATENKPAADDFMFTTIEPVESEDEDLALSANISASNWLADTGSTPT